MLKQILVTTAVVAIAAVSIQPASAKSRAIVVDGAGSDLLLKKGKTQNLFILKNGQGIPTPPSGGKPLGTPTANFIVAPNGGIPTPPPNGAGKVGGKLPALLVAQGSGISTPSGGGNPGKVQPLLLKTSGGGIPTPNGGGNGGNPGGVQPLLVKTSGGIPTQVASADPGPITGGGKSAPVIASPSEITAPTGGENADAAPVGVPAQPRPIVTPQAADNGGAPASPPPAPAATPATAGPSNLYSVLIAHGYDVEVMNGAPDGDLVFYVTTPKDPQAADILLVDARDGKVLERKHIANFAYAYDQAPAYAPRYASSDNCDHYSGY